MSYEQLVMIDGMNLNSEFLKWSGGRIGLPQDAMKLRFAIIEADQAPALTREIDFKCGAELQPGQLELDHLRFIPIPGEMLSAVVRQFKTVEVDAVGTGKAVLMQQQMSRSFG